jgi:hypothetical protein
MEPFRGLRDSAPFSGQNLGSWCPLQHLSSFLVFYNRIARYWVLSLSKHPNATASRLLSDGKLASGSTPNSQIPACKTLKVEIPGSYKKSKLPKG